MEQETFIFGHGTTPVPAHRHLNPDGSRGGWVAETASVAPTCFVGQDVQVFGNAMVLDSASLIGEARIAGNARVYGAARISDNAWVMDTAVVCDNATVYGRARVYDRSLISGDAEVFGRAVVGGDAEVFGRAVVGGDARIYDSASISDHAWVYDYGQIFGNANIRGNTKVFGYARVYTDQEGNTVWDWMSWCPPSLSEQRELARDILERVIERPGVLDMEVYHSECGTSHCIAGWAQVLRGESIGVAPGDDSRAYQCGVRLLPALASFFFEDRDVAIRELQKLAGE